MQFATNSSRLHMATLHNILPGIAATRHVVNGAGKFKTKRAGQGAAV
jgi:hypothetical protein